MTELKAALARLGRDHGYYNPDAGLFDALRKLLASPEAPDAEREARRLARLLRLRARATDAVAASRFAPIRGQTTETWGHWWAAVGEHGEDSDQARKARGAYLSALLNHDCELRCRLLDCALLVAESGRQARDIGALLDQLKAAERSQRGGDPRVAAAMQGLRTTLARLMRGHGRIVELAEAESRRIDTIKKSNDSWIGDVEGRTLGDAVRKALVALGIAA